MSCFDYRWLLRVPARASGLRTGILFCLLSFDAKTSFTVTVVIVVKDNLLGLLCRIFTQILGRIAMFYESLIHFQHDRSSFLWNLGNIGFPKQFFLNTQNWLELFQQVKPPLYANFVSNSTKATLGKKTARCHICFGLSSFKSCPVSRLYRSCFSRVTHDGDLLPAQENWYKTP